jgi:leader peptidase (prepilin peptidase) / N-methyltransferase
MSVTDVIIFFIGASIGSFLNVVADRSTTGKSFIRGRSYCVYCKNELKAKDLVPIFSYLFLRGKCRYCRANLSYFYPFTEILAGVVFLLSFSWGASFILPLSSLSAYFTVMLYALIVSMLLLIFIADMKYGVIPLNALLVAFASAISLHFTSSFFPLPILNYILSGLGAFLGFLAIFVITKGKGMGFGDVVYVLFMGFLLGFPDILLGLYIAVVSGAFVSVILIILKKKKLRGSTIPFGPFLVAGTYISLFWGNNIIDFVLGYLLA